jgi:rhamnogalacturonan endolyase
MLTHMMILFRTISLMLAIGLLPVWLHAEEVVALKQNPDVFTLANGIVTADISKHTGNLLSLKYKGIEMLDTADRRQAGYWSHNVAQRNSNARVTIDPTNNAGERGEVSVKGVYEGTGLAADIEIRYCLGRGDAGLYTYSIFNHPTNYPAAGIGEARYCVKLNDNYFDWMTVDSNRDMQMITAYDWNHGTKLNFKEARRMNSGIYKGQAEHKYDYSANQFDVRTWGWSSTGQRVGIWFINPSVEYLSGGPTKVELSAHRDATFDTDALYAPAPPCLLNYWRGSHYGGSSCTVAATDAWTKVIGPFLIYCNSGGVHDVLWQDALARQTVEEKAWPFDWVEGVDYPKKNERATVSGKIVLTDPQMPPSGMSNLLVGLSAPDYAPPAFRRGYRPPPRGQGEAPTSADNEGPPANDAARGRYAKFAPPKMVGWQLDAKYYQFWVRANPDGSFNIPNVRPGTYTLHGIADGVLGEFVLTNVTVTASSMNLGRLDWQPVRYGRQLWDIGIPNRNASEFFKGNDYYHWGWYLRYPGLFPDDVNFSVGTSDFRRDWFFEQVPHDENPNDTTGAGRGRKTTWTISFKLPRSFAGKAVLRLAICGVGARSLDATMNGKPIGTVTDLVYNATINRDGIGGFWSEHDLKFDASLMQAGENKLALTIPAGGLTSGIMYDYLRLELAEGDSKLSWNTTINHQ